jgi:hypothetical protein
MKLTIYLLLGSFAACGLLTGCGGDSFGRTGEERAHMRRTITHSEYLMAKDDIDVFLMFDRRSRLSRWH